LILKTVCPPIIEEVESEGVTLFFRRGPNKRTFGSPESPDRKFIEKREGIHHIALM
jgi:hypothetical protein